MAHLRRLLLFAVTTIASAAAPSGDVSKIVEALNVPGCPSLRALYSKDMKEALPAETTAKFCDGLQAKYGRFSKAEPAGKEDTWSVFRLKAEHGTGALLLAWSTDGLISGLQVTPWEGSALAMKTAPVRDTKTKLHWPLERETLVFWGGDTEASNRHVNVPEQRRALDLAMIGADGKTFRGDRSKNESFHIYGQPVHAAASGAVVTVIDGTPDNVPGQMNAMVVPGNLVVVEHSPGEVAWYAHLKSGSARVKVGQRVNTGDVLGLVGNSGNSSEPHLHFHVQEGAAFAPGLGLGLQFTGVDVVRDGTRAPTEAYRPLKGDRVTPTAKTAQPMN